MSRKVINCAGAGNCIMRVPTTAGILEPLVSYITKVPLFDTSFIENMEYMFMGFKSLKTIPPYDTTNVTNMTSMFEECIALRNIPILSANKVTDMLDMFHSCSSLEAAILVNTSNVTDMGGMFNGCSSLQDLTLTNWRQGDIDLSDSSKLILSSVHLLITSAIGYETRELILHGDAYAAWQDSEYYTADIAAATNKNITVQQAN